MVNKKELEELIVGIGRELRNFKMKIDQLNLNSMEVV